MAKEYQPKEDQILAAYFDWVRAMANTDRRFEMIIHVPNEGRRTFWGHVRAREKGLAKGFPDVVGLGVGAGAGFAIEAKSATGRLSHEQIAWGNRLAARGFRYSVQRTLEGMIDFTKQCLIEGKSDAGTM